ncbi:hypothetical protein H3990_04825 [Staphylococcus epidermidis]|uniref:hypothetical protein n=1 Tax=Staphylococcus epidermidis TaxID=1282 RepID=UPI0018876BF8|nr:hypothetical protein [Staphylococcus epidermidis]MBF2189433.1 hypothetical protein [Staphylococcus epidermidis]
MAEVKLSQESYDELLADITTLRAQADVYFEKWQDAKRKAEVFDEIDRLITNGVEKERDTQLIFQNICHVIINLKESGDIIYESKEANNEG